ncbi:unnamed protein product, partial [Vitis vinifera]|uniref:Uncharacterized protein n=1 Tax=Vitis vinifera TaxID=29760 RepID=D7TLK3_VITVI
MIYPPSSVKPAAKDRWLRVQPLAHGYHLLSLRKIRCLLVLVFAHSLLPQQRPDSSFRVLGVKQAFLSSK